MRVFTTLPQGDLRKVPDAAKQAEKTGYDGLLTLENRNEPFLGHAIAAVVTERIDLATSVAIAFARSPMVVANLGWDLQIASRGRFVLGLGPQIRPHNERRFSVPWSPPVPRLREYVKALRAIWTCWQKGEKLDFRGEHYTFTLMTPNFVPASIGMPMVPITLAGFGTYSLRLSGEVGDGLRLHPLCTRRYLEEVVEPRVAEGLEKSGKARENFEISGGGFLATGKDDEAVDKMAEWVRMRIAFYGSTPAYWPVLELHGLGDLGRKLNALSKEGKWDEMTTSIPDDFLHLCAAIGRHDEIAPIIERRFGNASDALNASVNQATPSDMPPDLLQDIQRIPVKFRRFATAW